MWLSLWSCCRDLWVWDAACSIESTKSELTWRDTQSRLGWCDCHPLVWRIPSFPRLSLTCLFPIPSPHWFPCRCCGQTPPSLRSYRTSSFLLAFRDMGPNSSLGSKLHWHQWAFTYSSKEFGISCKFGSLALVWVGLCTEPSLGIIFWR